MRNDKRGCLTAFPGSGKRRHMAGRKTAFLLCLTVSVCLLACGRKENAGGEEAGRQPIVNFRAITLGNMPADGMDEIYRQLDALTIPELNCTLRFEFIPWGNERKQLNIATASGEYDFIPGGVFSDYRILVYKNAFLDLNPYLDTVPELKEHYAVFDADTLKRCEVNGGLYGLPQLVQKEIRNIGEGFFYREDLRREWELPAIRDLETLEAYLYRAKQEEQYKDAPMVTDNRVWSSLWMMLTKGKYLEVNSFLETPFLVVDASDPYKVLNRMETPEFREVLSYIWKWKRDGILDSDMLSRSDNEGELGKSLILSEKKPCETNNPIWSINTYWIPLLYESYPQWEFGFYPYCSLNNRFYSSSPAGSSVISISAKTTEPELALKLLEKIHTDIRYYELVAYGTEGNNYNLTDGKISFDNIASENRFAWTAVTDETMNYEAVPVNEKWEEEYSAIMKWSSDIAGKAENNPLDGFTISPSEREQKAVEQVWLQYFQPLICGYGEDYDMELERANQCLYEAGFDRYLAAIQEQLSDYAKEKKDR